MEKNMSRSLDAGSNQATLCEVPSFPQPYDTSKIYLASKQPVPLIPISNTNNSCINDSSERHFQQMMPVQSSSVIVTNNLCDQFSLMPENSLTNQGHRHFFSEPPTFSNDIAYFGNDSDSASGDATASRNHMFIYEEFDDETFSKFFDLDEPDNSLTTFPVEKHPNANVSGPMPPFPPQSPTPARYELGMGSIPILGFKACEGLLSFGPTTQRMENSTHNRSELMDEAIHVSKTGLYASCSSFANRMKHYSPDELAEIFRVDPSRAKRILANRKAVAKIKHRKDKYKDELENKIQFLQSRVTTLRMGLAMMKSEVSSLTVKNVKLKLRLQAIEQQSLLRADLNERLNGELEHLKQLSSHASNAGILFQQHNNRSNSRRPTAGAKTTTMNSR